MFESLNGYLMQLKHGTQHAVTQVRVITSWMISFARLILLCMYSGSSSVVHYEDSDPWLKGVFTLFFFFATQCVIVIFYT